jgi:hypothetical protein
MLRSNGNQPNTRERRNMLKTIITALAIAMSAPAMAGELDNMSGYDTVLKCQLGPAYSVTAVNRPGQVES